MCGRFSLDTTKSEIAKTFECERVAFKGTSFNIAPSQSITVVRRDDDSKELLESLPETQLQMYLVSKTVNSPKNDIPDCIQPI